MQFRELWCAAHCTSCARSKLLLTLLVAKVTSCRSMDIVHQFRECPESEMVVINITGDAGYARSFEEARGQRQYNINCQCTKHEVSWILWMRATAMFDVGLAKHGFVKIVEYNWLLALRFIILIENLCLRRGHGKCCVYCVPVHCKMPNLLLKMLEKFRNTHIPLNLLAVSVYIIYGVWYGAT